MSFWPESGKRIERIREISLLVEREWNALAPGHLAAWEPWQAAPLMGRYTRMLGSAEATELLKLAEAAERLLGS